MSGRKEKLYTYGLTTLTIREWGDKLGINWRTLRNRLTDKWSIEKAFTTKVKK